MGEAMNRLLLLVLFARWCSACSSSAEPPAEPAPVVAVDCAAPADGGAGGESFELEPCQ